MWRQLYPAGRILHMVYLSPEELTWEAASSSSSSGGGGGSGSPPEASGPTSGRLAGPLPRASLNSAHLPPVASGGRPGEAPGTEGIVEAALRGQGALRLYAPVYCERYGKMRLSSNMVLEHYMVSYATVLRGVLQTLD